jgi:hypothetical protein
MSSAFRKYICFLIDKAVTAVLILNIGLVVMIALMAYALVATLNMLKKLK